MFNNTNVTQSVYQKSLGLILDSKLTMIYKAFVRHHLDYGDILYKQAFNLPFHQKLEFIQYKACLAIIGAIRGTSRQKQIYQ